MDRSFNSGDLVMLPVLDATGALAVTEELLARVKAEEVSSPVANAARRLRQAAGELRSAALARLETPGDANRKTSFLEEVVAINAMHDWLEGWTRMPEDKGGRKVAEAKQIFAALFGNGLKFLKQPHKSAWVEADHRIRWLEEQNVETTFRALGGTDFLDQLRATHKKCGAALGITKASTSDRAVPSLRKPLDLVRARLRQYVVQVVAMGESGSAENEESATRLLTPLAEWESPRVAGVAAASSEEEDPTPAAPPTSTGVAAPTATTSPPSIPPPTSSGNTMDG